MNERPAFVSLPPPDVALAARDVHVWRASLNVSDRRLAALSGIISEDELARAERFVFPAHRNQFIVGRGLLRTILARYLRIEPCEVRFRYDRYGKPAVAHDGRWLRFNLSHSHDLVLYAVTRDREIGVDLELMDPWVSDEALFVRSFSPREIDALQAIPAASRKAAFYCYWTRKEAYIKGRGLGLALPLRHFDVSRAPHEAVLAWDSAEAPLDGGRWYVEDLLPGACYAAALAVEGADRRLFCWRMPQEE